MGFKYRERNKIFRYNIDITHAVPGSGTKNILITSEDSAAHLLNNLGRKMVSFKHEDAVSNAVFSPDFKWVLTASWDKTARLWDAVTGKQTGPGMNHEAYVNSAVTNANGKWIITAGWDSAAHLWEYSYFERIRITKKAGWCY